MSVLGAMFDCETEREGRVSLLGWAACALAVASPFIGLALVGAFMGGR